MIDKRGFRLNRVIAPETKYMDLMEAIQEAELRFLLASLKGETITIFCSKDERPLEEPLSWI